MNAIVKTHYPVSSLPDDLRADLPADGTVEIRITVEQPAKPRIKLVDLMGTGRNVHGSAEDVVRHIREGRDDGYH